MKSITSGKEVKDITYLAELMLVRQYAKKGVNLPPHFWNLPEYKRDFQVQLVHARRLLKNFTFQSVLAVLRKEEWIYSLAIKQLTDRVIVYDKKQKLLADVAEKKPKPKTPTTTENKVIRKKDIFGELDN